MVSFLELKRWGPEINHSAASSVRIKNEWSYTFSPSIRLSAVASKRVTFTLIFFIYGSFNSTVGILHM